MCIRQENYCNKMITRKGLLMKYIYFINHTKIINKSY